MKLSELFQNCAYFIEYETVGNDVNYAFVEKGRHLYIYFEGSSSVTDWIRNFLFKAEPYKDMEIPYSVHRGFLAAWKEVEDIIIQKIKEKTTVVRKYKRSGKTIVREEYLWNKVTIVGYSHGGALAAFCHECVWYWRPDLRKSGLVGYGFEAPRIYGGYKVNKELEERWRTFTVIRTNNDIVTHCPPTIFRFCHVGTILEIKGDISYVQNKWLPKCIKSHYPAVVFNALVDYEKNRV